MGVLGAAFLGGEDLDGFAASALAPYLQMSGTSQAVVAQVHDAFPPAVFWITVVLFASSLCIMIPFLIIFH
jgi:hypothetical protein